MAATRLFTYRDAVRHVIDYLGADIKEVARRDARRAVLAAYREFSACFRWSYYYQVGRVDTVAHYNTGTVDFDFTGGTFERQLTLASGTWPTWATYGVVVISNVAYQVATRESSTVITLSPNSNPGADVAAGTTYTIYRDTYPMPSDFLASDQMTEASNNLYPVYVHPSHWLEMQRKSKSPAQPSTYTYTSDPNYFGTMAMRLHPPPDNIYHYDFIYQRRPRPLIYDEVSAGTVAVTSAAFSVTGTSTAFVSDHVGSVIRISDDGTNPPESLEWQNPYDQERVITAYTSATSLTVDTAWDTTRSAVRYIISDPVDIEEGAMMNAFLRCCERQVAISKSLKTKGQADADYDRALILAREADSRNFSVQQAGRIGQYRQRLASMPSGPDT